MSKSRRAYPPEFRRQMVGFVRAGRTPEELPREFEPAAQSIRDRVSRSDGNASRDNGGSRKLQDAGTNTRREIQIIGLISLSQTLICRIASAAASMPGILG